MSDFIVLAKYGEPYLEVSIRPEEVVAVEDVQVKEWPWGYGQLATRILLRNGERITLRARKSEVMDLLENE